MEITVDIVSQKKSFGKTTGEFLKERAVSTNRKDYCLSIVIVWSEGNGANKNNESEKAFVKKTNMFGARIKIMWEEPLVDPSMHYITFVNTVYPDSLY